MALGIFPLLFDTAAGIIQLIRPIPPIAWLPLAILWFGIEEGSKVFIIALGAFFPIFTNVLDGVRQTDHKFVELAQVLEVPKGRFILRVVVPGALPFIMTGLRVGLAFAWMCVVAAELSAGMKGVGYMLTDARALAQTDKVLVGMLAIGVVGKAMDCALQALEKRLIRWKTSFTGV
jgi:sulfonate transport system permease protein